MGNRWVVRLLGGMAQANAALPDDLRKRLAEMTTA